MKISHIYTFLAGAALASIFIYFFQPNQKKEVPDQTLEVTPTKVIEKEIQEKIIYQCPPNLKEKIFDPPEFHPSTPAVLVTNHEGEVKVRWIPIPDATSYHIKLYTLNGKLIRSWKTSRDYIYLKQIPFDENLELTPYRISLSTLNAKAESGPESELKDLNSKRLKNIIAPKIERITVED